MYMFIRLFKSNKHIFNSLIPHVEIGTLSLTRITNKHINLRAHLIVSNPLPFGLKIDSIQCIVHIGGKRILNSAYTTEIFLKRSDTSAIDIPLLLYYKNMQAIVNLLDKEGRDSIMHTFDIILYSNLFPGKAFHIHKDYELPFLYIPGFRVIKTSIAKVGMKGITLDVKACLSNKNIFSFSCKKISYELKFEDHKVITGSIPGTILLASKDSILIHFPIIINYKEAEKSIVDRIGKGKKLRYDIILNVQLETSNHILNRSYVVIKASGEWDKLRKAIK
jgi:LEA14-like dessication related protein